MGWKDGWKDQHHRDEETQLVNRVGQALLQRLVEEGGTWECFHPELMKVAGFSEGEISHYYADTLAATYKLKRKKWGAYPIRWQPLPGNQGRRYQLTLDPRIVQESLSHLA